MKKIITGLIVSISFVAICTPVAVFAQYTNSGYVGSPEYSSVFTPDVANTGSVGSSLYSYIYTPDTIINSGSVGSPAYSSVFTPDTVVNSGSVGSPVYSSVFTPDTYTSSYIPDTVINSGSVGSPAYSSVFTPDTVVNSGSVGSPVYSSVFTPDTYTSSYIPTYGSPYVPTYNYPNYSSLYNYGTQVVPVGTIGSNVSISWSQQYHTCWNGTTIPINQTCPAQTQTCPNGTVIPIGSICPATTQTCWNGSVIPTTQACPAQYQTCPNGSVIPVNQTCPAVYNYTPTYVPPIVYNQPTYYTPSTYIPQTITVNNVVTGIPTQITNTSAKCNGIGLIANNLQSTGWFEYGETPSLGRTTQSVNIGSNHTSPFSNVLANLKPNTTYYCRAGMSNSYGTVRGEIVKFTTKSNAVTYVKPVTTVKKKTTVKKATNICTNETATLAEGEKAVTLVIEKTKGETNLKGDVTYTLSYKNISSSGVKNSVIKIALPQEFVFVSTTAGSYDEVTRNITVDLGSLGALSEGNISFTVNVSETAQIGKTVITTGYIVYTISDSSKIIEAQDEVTTYALATIMPATDTGAKKVIGKDDGVPFLPNSFVEWIALLAIIFILIVLGRSIYESYKETDKKK